MSSPGFDRTPRVGDIVAVKGAVRDGRPFSATVRRVDGRTLHLEWPSRLATDGIGRVRVPARAAIVVARPHPTPRPAAPAGAPRG